MILESKGSAFSSYDIASQPYNSYQLVIEITSPYLKQQQLHQLQPLEVKEYKSYFQSGDLE